MRPSALILARGYGGNMLFIQKIVIYYGGKERSAEYVRERENLRFLPVKNSPNSVPDCEVFMHSLNMRQYEHRMIVRKEQVCRMGKEVFGEGTRSAPWYHKGIFENIRIFREEDSYRIMFCDDFHYGNFSRTKRHGRNEAYNKKGSPFRYADRLNETAFRLGTNQYGRIIFNNRFVHPTSRNQIYVRYIYNIINCDRDRFREKMFLCKKPDFEYKNLKSLY